MNLIKKLLREALIKEGFEDYYDMSRDIFNMIQNKEELHFL